MIRVRYNNTGSDLLSVVLYMYYGMVCIKFCFISHALKNTSNQRPGLPLHILRYATGSIPLYFLVITCVQQFTGVHLRTSQKPAPKLFTITSISDHVRKFSEDFRKF